MAVASGVFLVDQITKVWARGSLGDGDSFAVIPGLLNLIYAENTGVAFSRLSGGGQTGRWVLAGSAGVASAVVLLTVRRTPHESRRILAASSLFLAGILGNMANRVWYGFVIDWIDVQFGSWHYPTFNLADAAICAGAALVIFDMIVRSRQ